MKTLFLNSLMLCLAFLTFSCNNSDDDNNSAQQCHATNVTMRVNGEVQSFQAVGRGLNLTENGYVLDISMQRSSLNPYREQSIFIQLPYRKTGHNAIDKFLYHQYIEGVAFDGDFLDGEFECDVASNTKNCFYATFSGKLNDGTQEIAITDGVVSYTYETPFDN